MLFKRGAYTNAPRPGLILLDINLPKVNGVEVLKKIKETEELRVIPVIMLTTSDRDEEALKCYSFGANSFITKPVKFTEFSEKVKSLKLYWLLVNRPPKSEASTSGLMQLCIYADGERHDERAGKDFTCRR
ncbi:MAG: response regulator [Candidatus Manganitrophus sp.]|nr:response regulator [Candidatus Manganitrophus sp.]